MRLGNRFPKEVSFNSGDIMKKSYLLLCLGLLSLNSCGPSDTNSSPNGGDNPVVDANYYQNVEQRAKFNKESQLNFNDDFTNGIDDDVFAILDAKWNAGGIKEHNGVRKRNIFYTKDSSNNGYVAIKGRGLYNQEEGTIEGSPEGGCFITKNHLGPGRYEIKMAAMPREGGITAFWTYCTTTGSEATSQNEIDIEIGGKTNGTSYEALWATTWTTHENKTTEAVDVTNQLYLNDGKIHTYTFDWYTAYPGSLSPRIDWFIDGKYVVSVENDSVPTHDMPLWIGLWFQSWAGEAQFDTDYLLIDQVSYTAFEETQTYTKCRAKPQYTQFVPSQSDIPSISMETIKNTNKLANAQFSKTSSTKDGSLYGWFNDASSKGTSEIITGDKNYLKLTASSDTSENYHGQYTKQTITEAYPGYKFDFSINARKENEASKGQINLYYYDKRSTLIKNETIDLDSLTDKNYSKSIVMPDKSYSLVVELTADDGITYFSDASLIFRGTK